MFFVISMVININNGNAILTTQSKLIQLYTTWSGKLKDKLGKGNL